MGVGGAGKRMQERGCGKQEINLEWPKDCYQVKLEKLLKRRESKKRVI